jgi:hypothetical protein
MIAGNLPPKDNNNPTTTYFNNFFTQPYNVSQGVDDAVVGYFQELTGDNDTGTTLAAAVLYTAVTQKIDPMALIDEFRRLQRNQLNAYLTMFLNLNRVNTSLLGLSNSPSTNKYIARAILP